MQTPNSLKFTKNLPNIISSIRIAGAFTLPFIMQNSLKADITLPFINITLTQVPVVWVIVFFFLAISDRLDGVLARRLKAESNLGAALDALGDILVLTIGAWINIRLMRGTHETSRHLLFAGLAGLILPNMLAGVIFAKIYHGKANKAHTYYLKFFAICYYITILFWALIGTIPGWTIYILVSISTLAAIDECIYCVRTAEYNPNFKGHWLEKYKKR